MGWKDGVQLHQPVLNQQCVAEHAYDKWHCAVAPVAARYTETPLLVMQSVYDTWQLNFVLFCLMREQGAPCTLEQKALFGEVSEKSMSQWVKSRTSALRGHAAILDKCNRHGRSVD